MANILITGGNRGIGSELAKRYAARGDRVIASTRDAGDAPAPKGVEFITMDVASETSVKAAAASLHNLPIDLVINNAGQLNGYGGLGSAEHSQAAWAAVLMTNVAGPYFVAVAFLPNLRAGRGRKLAIITSGMGSSERASGGAYPYRASKARATNLARNLARDLAVESIAVGAYHPGWVRTDMGGPGAAIGVEESAQGLMARFDALTLATSGIVEDYQGTPVPF